jgi:cytochrome c-type biogenesis protein CcmF
MWPTIGAVAAMAFLMITPASWGSPFGMRPWQDVAYLYSLMAIGLSVLVTLTIASEYYRGGKVIAGHTGQGMFASMVQLTHRNTRRYGGYIVHFGVVVVIIGFAGSAFNQDKESGNGLAYGDKMTIGSYELVCRSYTQDDAPNYSSEWAIMDVYQNGKMIDTLTPQRLFYKASRQASTKPSIRSTFKEDLYLVYEGQNEKGNPIIKAHLNPLVMWIWLGVWIILGGTVLALIPNAPAPVRVPAARRVAQVAPVATGV